MNSSSFSRTIAYGVLVLAAIMRGGCESFAVHDATSLLSPPLHSL
jgi:hypothetical protein